MDRRYSLKKNKEFQYVYRAGKSHADRNMVIIVARARHGGIRVGFSVSKKVGNSVVRNRVKRRMRECFRARLDGVKRGYSIVFVARDAAALASFDALGRSMDSLLRRASLNRALKA